jgi:hypothetical protein
MDTTLLSTTARRSFLQRVAIGSAALAATGWTTARAEAPAADSSPDEAWIARIRGTHKQVFDGVTPNDGAAALFALNFVDTTSKALGLSPTDITAVVVLRHFAMPLALKDDVWNKYKIGAALKINDPKTSAPTLRNIYRDDILLHPGLTYDTMLADPRVVMTVCEVALTALSNMTGAAIGVSPDAAKAEWIAGLHKGVYVVPSGVYAVHRAQQAGCTYCSGG